MPVGKKSCNDMIAVNECYQFFNIRQLCRVGQTSGYYKWFLLWLHLLSIYRKSSKLMELKIARICFSKFNQNGLEQFLNLPPPSLLLFINKMLFTISNIVHGQVSYTLDVKMNNSTFNIGNLCGIVCLYIQCIWNLAMDNIWYCE